MKRYAHTIALVCVVSDLLFGTLPAYAIKPFWVENRSSLNIKEVWVIVIPEAKGIEFLKKHLILSGHRFLVPGARGYNKCHYDVIIATNDAKQSSALYDTYNICSGHLYVYDQHFKIGHGH